MKVMFEPSIGTTFSCCGKNRIAKNTTTELPIKHEGYSNEEIYNAIMNFKNRLTRVFSRQESPNKSIDAFA